MRGGIPGRATRVAVAVAVAALGTAAVASVRPADLSRAHALGRAELRIGDGRGGVRKHRVAGFNSPTYITAAPGAPRFLYVVERGGSVRAVKHGHRLAHRFLAIGGRVSTGGERGLLSIAFDPRYQRNHLFYAYYTNDAGDIEVDEFRARSNRDAKESSRRKVIVIPHPGASNHNGGTVTFGPRGLLYLATGDGGGVGDPRENAQNKHRLLGKVLRINPHRHGGKPYRVPHSNPFVGRAGRNEIFALGLRNPFRLSFDRGRILIGDVGQDVFEEVDLEGRRSLRAANFGWDHFEGDHRFNGPGDNEAPRPRHHYEPPILDYRHTGSNCESFGGCAVTGGVVVRNRRLSSLRGRYLYADFYAGKLRSFIPRSGHARGDKALGVHVDHPSSFAKGAGGRIYVTSLDGPLYQLVHR